MGNKIRIRWLGHAGFEIISPQGKVVVIDPWLGGPTSSAKLEDFNSVDLVLVTHDHFDHASDAAEITKRTGALLIANVETASRIQKDGQLPDDHVIFGGYGMNVGGWAEVKGLKVLMTQAIHSTATGISCGYIVEMEDGRRIYHAGDTGLFETMRLYGELYPLEVALLPIGGVFTMDPVQAAKAAELLRAKRVIPMHYLSFPILEQSADSFAALVTRKGIAPTVLKPGEICEI
jgi:L-ascorbate metabolism protein UlaG (beta-lactamase superfamily)